MDGKRMPGAHPKPYESALWQHLDTIRLLRRQRKTWAAIAAHLQQAHGLKASFQAVQKFFKRASGAQIPLGFNDTGLTARREGSSKPSAEPGVQAHNDPFSVEAIPEELFVKTKRRYAKEHKA
jgi:hypothetical protein